MITVMLLVSTLNTAQASTPQFKHFPGYKANTTKGVGVPYMMVRPGVSKGPYVGKPGTLPDPTLGGPPQPRLDCAGVGVPSGTVGSVLQTRSVTLFTDWSTGDLWAFQPKAGGLNGGGCADILTSPVPSVGYVGNAIEGPYGFYDIVAALNYFGTGWVCLYTNGGASSDYGLCVATGLIGPPAAFCAAQPAGVCNPDGQAFDPSGNLWYVDVVNGDEVELLAGCGFTCVGTVNYYPASISGVTGLIGTGGPVVGLAIDTFGNHYTVTGFPDCSGTFYYNLIPVFAIGGDSGAVALSATNHYHTTLIYVSVNNFCGTYKFPFVGDISTGFILPHPYSAGVDQMYGISNLITFGSFYGNVWTTYE